jgi:hypothetical protein
MMVKPFCFPYQICLSLLIIRKIKRFQTICLMDRLLEASIFVLLINQTKTRIVFQMLAVALKAQKKTRQKFPYHT